MQLSDFYYFGLGIITACVLPLFISFNPSGNIQRSYALIHKEDGFVDSQSSKVIDSLNILSLDDEQDNKVKVTDLTITTCTLTNDTDKIFYYKKRSHIMSVTVTQKYHKIL